MLSNHYLNQLKNKKIAVLGLGREGLSTFKFLKKNKIKSEILDAKFDKNYLNRLDKYGLIFRTPGFPRLHPKLLAAEKKGAAVSSHIKLFFDLCPGKIIGITGTKGKTTTAFLIYEILKKRFGRNVFMAGNFGKPALEILPNLKRDSLVVLELSSFQLQDLHKSPQVAVITNLTLDHMDPSGRFAAATHQTAKEYFDAKMNILKFQKNNDFVVTNPSLKKRTKNLGKGRKIYPSPLSLEIPIGKANRGSSIPLCGIGTKLKGGHNLENIALAIEAGKIFKVPKKDILKAVKNFKGVEHRLEFVGLVNSVSFYNDSAATNPDATTAALKSFTEPVHLILGGSEKGLDYKRLAKHISKSKNIKTIALIGQIKNKLYKTLKARAGLKIKKNEKFKEAVLTLYKKADKNGGIVLLSPGTASFGMFENYAQRGVEFKKLVRQLWKGASYGNKRHSEDRPGA